MNETFHVTHRGFLSEDDHRVLSLLYLPMMKRDAYSLYIFLNSLTDAQKKRSIDYPLPFLYDALSLNPESFKEARVQLEAAQLLKTFDANAYTFEIQKPLNAEDFFQKSPFIPYLRTIISKERLADLKHHLMPVNKISGKDVSAPFSAIYPSLKPYNELPETSESIVFDVAFEIEDVLSRVPKTILKDDERTPSFKQNIKQLIYIFSLSEDDLKTVIIDAKKTLKDLSFEALSERASHHVRQDAPPVKDAYNLYYFKKRHPVDILKDITGSHLPKAEMAMVEKIIREAGLPLEVISVLMAYVLSELNGQMPHITYFEKVIGQWHRNKVKDAESAIAMIKKGKAVRNQKKTSKKPDTDIDWFKDYLNEKDAQNG